MKSSEESRTNFWGGIIILGAAGLAIPAVRELRKRKRKSLGRSKKELNLNYLSIAGSVSFLFWLLDP